MRAIVTDEEVLGGDPRLEGTRIGIVTLYQRYEDGESPEGIAAGYDGVTVADVHAALAYAFDHPEEMRAVERRGQEAVERIRDERSVDPEEFKKRV